MSITSGLMLGSLGLGLLAWALPVIGLALRKRVGGKGRAALSAGSVSACALSLFLQILYANHRVDVRDWSALMDTFQTVTKVSAILLIVTMILNGVAWFYILRKR